MGCFGLLRASRPDRETRGDEPRVIRGWKHWCGSGGLMWLFMHENWCSLFSEFETLLSADRRRVRWTYSLCLYLVQAYGVECELSESAGRKVRLVVRSRFVVCAAGSVHTPALLLRSKFSNDKIGRHLCLHPVIGIIGNLWSLYRNQLGGTP